MRLGIDKLDNLGKYMKYMLLLFTITGINFAIAGNLACLIYVGWLGYLLYAMRKQSSIDDYINDDVKFKVFNCYRFLKGIKEGDDEVIKSAFAIDHLSKMKDETYFIFETKKEVEKILIHDLHYSTYFQKADGKTQRKMIKKLHNSFVHERFPINKYNINRIKESGLLLSFIKQCKELNIDYKELLK